MVARRRSAEPITKVYAITQFLDDRYSDGRTEVEARMIGQMAREAHQDGYRFDGWPTVEATTDKSYVNGVRLRATVLGVPA